MLSDPSTLLFQAVCALGLYLLLTLLQFAGRRILVLREMRRPLNVLFALGAVHTFLGDRLAAVHPSLRMAVLVAFLTLLAFAGIRLVDRLLFDMLPARRQRQPVPVVVRDILKWILWGTAVFFILRSTVLPNLKLSVLAVSSIVVGYILGNASQDTLGNLIAGLALNTERPFSIGDWVQVGEFAGRVSDMTWRATRLQTKARDHIIIPNSTIAREFIVNYSRPTTAHGFTQQIGVNYDVPPNVVRETLIRVCDEIPEILPHPRPVVWLQNYNDFSMDYVLKFYINDFARLEEIQSLMMDRVWYHFKRRGIVIPFPSATSTRCSASRRSSWRRTGWTTAPSWTRRRCCNRSRTKNAGSSPRRCARRSTGPARSWCARAKPATPSTSSARAAWLSSPGREPPRCGWPNSGAAIASGR